METVDEILRKIEQLRRGQVIEGEVAPLPMLSSGQSNGSGNGAG